jgi:hypothetical protein
VDLTVINTIWRPVYDKLQRALRLSTPEWRSLRQLKNFTQLSPRAINWPVEMFYGGGMVWTTDGGSTALAKSNQPVEATDDWKHLAGRFEVSFDVLTSENASQFTKQQIKKQVRYQAADKAKSFRRAISIGFYGHNDAVLFKVNSAAGAPTYTIKDLYGETGLTATRIRDYITATLDTVAILNPTGPAERGRQVVNSIDESGVSITLAASIGSAAADDLIVLANHALTGDSAEGDYGDGINGLLDLTRAATVHNLAGATYPDWVAGVDESSYGAVLNAEDMFSWFETISERSGHPVEWGYTTVGVLAKAGGTQVDQRRYNPKDDTLNIGFRKIKSMGVILASRPYVPGGFLFLGSNSALRKLAPDEDVKNVVTSGDRAGGFKEYTDRLGFYKDMVFRANLTVVSRLGLGVVSGITEV